MQPENHNLLSTLNFKMVIDRVPTVSYFAQSFVLPGLTLPEARTGNPFTSIPQIGDHIQFEPLSFTFKIDEDLANWLEVYTWMQSLGFPENWDQHARLPPGVRTTRDTQTSDISVITTTNARNGNKIFTFKDAWPTSLGSLEFDTMATALTYADATVVFNYTYFTVSDV